MIADYAEVSDVVKALNSPLRRRILSLLYHNEMNILHIARELGIPQSTCTVNVQILERAKLIKTKQKAASKGSQKICVAVCEEVVLPLQKHHKKIDENTQRIEMPIGLFTDFHIFPPCGLLTEKEIIGYFDRVDSFLDPHRAKAQLLWFKEGYIEYPFPAHIPPGKKIAALSFTMEICSEFPGANPDWPSDITLWINGHDAGTWTSPGDMGDEKGRHTPGWWSIGNTQYGFLKTWRVTRECSYVDGVHRSNTVIDDLDIPPDGRITVRIGNKEESENKGGVNLFGRRFGNYGNDLVMQIELEEIRSSGHI